MSRPDGLVDPLDPTETAPVLAAALRTMGDGGVVDLLRRLPGVRLVAARPRKLFSPAVAAQVWLGEEHCVAEGVGGEPPAYQHVVGGIVLARDRLTDGVLPDVLARAVAGHLREQAGRAGIDEAAVVFSAVRDTAG